MEVFAGPLWVHYGQAYVLIGDSDTSHMQACFRGQVNGLCGTAVSGAMFLMTGLHTGQVDFTVEISGPAPDLDLSWEEIVEAPFLVPDLPVALYQWGDIRSATPFGGRPVPRPIQRAQHASRT
jgi:hypothetical protein